MSVAHHWQLRPVLHLHATGGALYAWLEAVRRCGIPLKALHLEGDALECVIRKRDRESAMAWAEKHHVTLHFTEPPSLFRWLVRYRHRFGMPLGMLLGAALLLYTANVVMVIEVQGCETIPQTQILAVLSECGIRRGTFVGSIDFDTTERTLRKSISAIGWVGIRHTGNRLVVEVLEASPQPKMCARRIPCHIVATKTAQITAASAQCGTLLVQEGDVVKEGQVLIRAVQTDAYGDTVFRHAMGSITGIYEETQTFFCGAEQTERMCTGAQTIRRTLDFFTLRLPLGRIENPYGTYRQTTRRTPLTLFGKDLPIAVETTVWAETAMQQRTLTSAEMQEILTQQQEQYAADILSDVTILETTQTFSVQQDPETKKETAMTLTVSYVLEGEIGTEKPLLITRSRAPYVASRKREAVVMPPEA